MRPLIPTTLVDSWGQIVGILGTDGHLHEVCPSNVGLPCVGWNEKTNRREVIGTTVWDGAAPAAHALGSKGELLGDYAELARVWQRLGIVGPSFKTAHYGCKEET